jgi:hypothetical protein
MPQRVHDRVKETTSTTGTGDITLAGAVSQFAAFSAVFVVDEPILYAIVGQSGSEWEVGKGHLSGSSTLVRDEVTESSNSSGSAGSVTYSLVSFSSGTKDVFCTLPAARIEEIWTKGQVTALVSGLAMP